MSLEERLEEFEVDEDGYPLDPLMTFHPDPDGNLRLTLWGWDTKESWDGHSVSDIDNLIQSLEEAKEFLLNNSDNAQGEFEFKGDNDV